MQLQGSVPAVNHQIKDHMIDASMSDEKVMFTTGPEVKNAEKPR